MDNGTPIYDISKTCDHLFVGILSKPDAASVLVAEVLHQRFKQWASYLGVFAPENVSLDTRLMYSESISQLVVQFLQIASRNLDRIGKLDEVLKVNNSVGEGLQRSVAEEVDHAPESGASSPLTESLRALKTAIDGLYRLGVAIRQSSSPTVNQRISNFAQENDDIAIENMVFFRLEHKFFNKDQKGSNSKSPLSLYRQLAISISFRYFGLLYRQSRQKKIEKNRESAPVKVPDQRPEVNIPPRKPAQSKKKGGPNELQKLAVANAGMKQQPEKSEGAPTTVNTKNILQKYAATEKSFAAPKSVLSAHIKDAKYPDPPKVDPRTREARCPFCGRPIFELDLKKKDWWHHHLNQDLKLYACLSEACAEPPQLFIRFHEWSQHMDEHHSTNWIEEIHKPLGWCCDVEHDDRYFDDEDEYDQHVKEIHPEYEAEKAELKEWGELQRERPPYTCPICNCVPEELVVIFPSLCEGKLANPGAIGTEAAARGRAEREEAARDKLLLHIGTHLKQLGLVSVAYFGDDANDNSMGGKRSSIPIDKDGKVLLVENLPDYFDPQFEGYIVPMEPKLLDEGVDWSDVKTLETNHAPFIVPFARNPHFTGHESHLARLEEHLFTKDGTTRIAITGLGGIGKTQLVLEFLYRTRDMPNQCLAIWVPATNPQSLDQAYVDVARKLSVPGWDDEMADVKKLVQEFLNKDDAGQWLMIFDGADDLDMWIGTVESGLPHGQVTQPLINYLPESRQGAIIFTTRNRKTALALAPPNVIEVLQMDENAAAQLLKKCLVNPHLVDNRQDTNVLLSQFAYLPLFIVQVAAYINETGITLAQCLLLAEQEEHIINLLSHGFEEDGRYHNKNNKSVLTWLVSIEQIKQCDPLAADYLSFMACVDSKDIPWPLLPPGPSHEEEVDAIGTLIAVFSMTGWPAEQLLNLHQLVRLAAREWLQKEELLAQWTQKAISRLGEVLPDDDYKNINLWRTCLPHALYVLDSNLVNNEEECRLGLMRKCGLFCLSDGRWKKAESLFEQLTEIYQRVLGVEHLDTLTSTGNLALTYRHQGRLKEAEELEVRVKETRKGVRRKELFDIRGKETVSYEGYTYTKYRPQIPGHTETWSRAKKTSMEMSQKTLYAEAKKQKNKGPSDKDMIGFKRRQIDHLIEQRTRTDEDPRFEYKLASLKLKQHANARGQRETTSMQVILKRQPRPGVVQTATMRFREEGPSEVSDLNRP